MFLSSCRFLYRIVVRRGLLSQFSIIVTKELNSSRSPMWQKKTIPKLTSCYFIIFFWVLAAGFKKHFQRGRAVPWIIENTTFLFLLATHSVTLSLLGYELILLLALINPSCENCKIGVHYTNLKGPESCCVHGYHVIRLLLSFNVYDQLYIWVICKTSRAVNCQSFMRETLLLKTSFV